MSRWMQILVGCTVLSVVAGCGAAPTIVRSVERERPAEIGITQDHDGGLLAPPMNMAFVRTATEAWHRICVNDPPSCDELDRYTVAFFLTQQGTTEVKFEPATDNVGAFARRRQKTLLRAACEYETSIEKPDPRWLECTHELAK